jgi:hypothetical protein
MTAPVDPRISFPHLNAEQANGLVCIVCYAAVGDPPDGHVPVGISATTRGEVFACEGDHARSVGYVAPVGEQQQLQLGAGR